MTMMAKGRQNVETETGNVANHRCEILPFLLLIQTGLFLVDLPNCLIMPKNSRIARKGLKLPEKGAGR